MSLWENKSEGQPLRLEDISPLNVQKASEAAHRRAEMVMRGQNVVVRALYEGRITPLEASRLMASCSINGGLFVSEKMANKILDRKATS
jgi:hypothetical protein